RLLARPAPRSSLFPYTTLFRSLASDRLQREVVLLHRRVVLQLLERQARAAAAAQVGHFQLPGRPDALDGLNVRILQPANNLALEDRKSTRLNSSHQIISYAVFC